MTNQTSLRSAFTAHSTRLAALAAIGLVLATLTSRASATPTPSAPAPVGAPVAAASASASSGSVSDAALRSFDWSTVTLPASSCDPDASGDITLAAGAGTVTVDASRTYAVTAQLPPDIGEAGGQPAAVLRYSCILEGSNGVGAFPVAVFVPGAAQPELAGVLQNSDLGTAPNGSAVTHDAVTFVDGQIVIAGKYLTDSDPRCCASGAAWTSVALVNGRPVAAGSVTVGAVPASLPAVSAPPTGSAPTGQAGAADLIVYSPEVQVQSPADLDQLTGAPDDFKQFIKNLRQSYDAATCTAIISVSRLSLTGFANGGLGCAQQGGGSAMLWYRDGTTWKLLAELQNTPRCDLLQSVHFPADVLGSGTCFDADYNEVPYTG